MIVKGKLEVFKNKKGYPTGVIKSFDADNKPLGRLFVAVNLKDDKVKEKLVDGKTLTLDVETGYLDVRHVELEAESFEIPVISIVKASIVSIYPEKKQAKKTTKKSSK